MANGNTQEVAEEAEAVGEWRRKMACAGALRCALRVGGLNYTLRNSVVSVGINSSLHHDTQKEVALFSQKTSYCLTQASV